VPKWIKQRLETPCLVINHPKLHFFMPKRSDESSIIYSCKQPINQT
jgi:hypothetical protein